MQSVGVLGLTGLVLVAACSGGSFDGGGGSPADGDVGASQQEILNGTASAEANSGIVQLLNEVGTCTGRLMTNRFVLTAAHCVHLHWDRDFTLASSGRVVGNRTVTSMGAAAVDSSGRLVIGGSTSDKFYLVRFTAAGALDVDFGSGGEVITDFASASREVITDLAIQTDGRIVAAGYATDATSGRNQFALARYETNGSLDVDYNHDGKVLTDFVSTDGAVAKSVKLDVRRWAIAAGYATVNGKRQFALARYTFNGELDETFDHDGKVLTDFASEEGAVAEDVGLDSVGRIVAAGWSSRGGVHHVAAARYVDSGAPDELLDGDGQLVLSDNETVGRSLLMQGTKLVIGGYRGDVPAIWRFQSHGPLDAGFGGTGRVLPDLVDGGFPLTEREVVDMTPAGDGRLRLAIEGKSSKTGKWVTGYATLGANGEVLADRAFPSTQGMVVTSHLTTPFRPNAIAVSGSRTFIVGEAEIPFPIGTRAFVSVLQPDRTQDTSFGGAILAQMDTDTIGADRAFLSSSNDDVAILRLSSGMLMNGSRDGFQFAGFLSDFSTLTGSNVTCRGYGNNAFDAAGNQIGSGTLRRGTSRVTALSNQWATLGFVPGATDQLPLTGDSGASCTFGGLVIGVHSLGDGTFGKDVRANRFSAWANGVAGL